MGQNFRVKLRGIMSLINVAPAVGDLTVQIPVKIFV
jgi:hypothetical protein